MPGLPTCDKSYAFRLDARGWAVRSEFRSGFKTEIREGEAGLLKMFSTRKHGPFWQAMNKPKSSLPSPPALRGRRAGDEGARYRKVPRFLVHCGELKAPLPETWLARKSFQDRPAVSSFLPASLGKLQEAQPRKNAERRRELHQRGNPCRGGRLKTQASGNRALLGPNEERLPRI